MNTKQFIEQSRELHNNKYDYSNTSFSSWSDRVTINCSAHGDFNQLPRVHLNGSGCPKCAAGTITHDEFIRRASEVHNNTYTYEHTRYVNSKTKVIITCPIHGDFEQMPSAHLKGSTCRKCAGKDMDTDEFIRRASEVHNNTYTYEHTRYVNSKTKVIITCPIHGDFEQQPNQHLYGYGCNQCKYDTKRYSTAEFVCKASCIHSGKYTYNKTQYISSQEKVIITCPIHGDFEQMPYSHLAGKGCAECYAGYNRSKGEDELAVYVSSLGYAVITNYRKYGFELDIFVPDMNIAFEYNGAFWHSELQGKNKKYHNNKSKACADNGIQLIHIWEHDWNTKQELIKSRIKAKLGINERIYARKTVIECVSDTHMHRFLNENHIQGSCPASIRYGLYHNDELVALMTFGKSRYKKDIKWELIRYCSKQGINVVGGAGRLLTYFMSAHDGDIISYSDRMWNNGGLYKAIGFEYSHTSEPAYYYTKDYVNFENRVKYQKHKLPKILETFNPNNTEWENMQANGYDRIWDCGNDVWILRRP